MSYVRYDESIYRTGHRMFGLTDPFTASHGLNGINHGYGGFGPWLLHGYPFTERGGETLGGLGAMVPDQSVVTYQGTWPGNYLKGAQDIIHQVTATLGQEGLQVRSLSSDAGGIAGQGILNSPFHVTMKVQVTNGQGYGDPNDIISIINNAVYVATGSMPTTGTIPVVQAPGNPSPEQTGQPPAGNSACLFYDPTDPNCSQIAPTDFATWLENNAMWIGLGIAGLVLLPKLIGGR